jgi:hypothetical protein
MSKAHDFMGRAMNAASAMIKKHAEQPAAKHAGTEGRPGRAQLRNSSAYTKRGAASKRDVTPFQPHDIHAPRIAGAICRGQALCD